MVEQSFPVPKSDPSKVRIVADFRNLNEAFKRPHWPTESSGQLLKHINADSKVFCAINTTSGYHQVQVDPESQKLLNIVTQQGRYCYTDLFNLLTDGEARYDETGCLKNMDDWLLFAQNLEGLDKKIINLMESYKKKKKQFSLPHKKITRCLKLCFALFF